MNTIAPQFIVDNVLKSVAFYTEKLGFKINWIQDHDPRFAIIEKEGATLMLRQLKTKGYVRPNRIPFVKSGWHTTAAEAWDAYIWVEDVEALYHNFKKNNVSFIKEVQETNYGNLDFEIEDIDGYILCFGTPLKD